MPIRASMMLAAALALTLSSGCTYRVAGRLASDPLPQLRSFEEPPASTFTDEDLAQAIVLAHRARLAIVERRCDDAVSLFEQARSLSIAFPDEADGAVLAGRCASNVGVLVSVASRR